jgi:hypothetical protein
VIDRDLRDASLPGLSADRVFATAYNAGLQLAKLAIACAGFRPTFGPGHHQTTFEAARLALGPGSKPLTDYFEICRRKRNTIDYDAAQVASDVEAQEIFQKANDFRQIVDAWIKHHHPNLAP